MFLDSPVLSTYSVIVISAGYLVLDRAFVFFFVCLFVAVGVCLSGLDYEKWDEGICGTCEWKKAK